LTLLDEKRPFPSPPLDGGLGGTDMQQAVSARTPAHLWIVGVVSLCWNAFGCIDYLMINMRNEGWLSMMQADQMPYLDSLPAWNTGMWAIGVWGGLLGAILLLMRSRYSVWAYALSFIGAVVGLGYQMFMTQMPASMKEGVMGMLPWFIILFAAFQLWYAWNAERKGMLR
jgi:hypothetical protein